MLAGLFVKLKITEISVKNLIRTIDRLKRSAVKHESQHLMNSYKQYLNRANSLNKALKKQYFSDNINNNKRNIEYSWKTINQLLNNGPNLRTL